MVPISSTVSRTASRDCSTVRPPTPAPKSGIARLWELSARALLRMLRTACANVFDRRALADVLVDHDGVVDVTCRELAGPGAHDAAQRRGRAGEGLLLDLDPAPSKDGAGNTAAHQELGVGPENDGVHLRAAMLSCTSWTVIVPNARVNSFSSPITSNYCTRFGRFFANPEAESQCPPDPREAAPSTSFLFPLSLSERTGRGPGSSYPTGRGGRGQGPSLSIGERAGERTTAPSPPW